MIASYYEVDTSKVATECSKLFYQLFRRYAMTSV